MAKGKLFNRGKEDQPLEVEKLKPFESPSHILGNNKMNFNFIVGGSPDALLEQIRRLPMTIKIVALYPQGGQHVLWFIGDKIINKIQK